MSDAELHSLIAALRQPGAPNRAIAATQAGDLGLESAIPALVGCLADADVAVAEASAEALVMLRSAAVAAAVAPLIRSEDLPERNHALAILGRLGPLAGDVLAPLCCDPDPDVRLFAVETLSAGGVTDRAAELIERLEDDNVNVATAAAIGLGRLGDRRAVGPLLGRLAGETWIKVAAMRSLAELGGPQAETALVGLLEAEEPLVSFSAAEALALAGTASSLPPLRALLEHDRADLRDAAGRALVRILAREGLHQEAAEVMGTETILRLAQGADRETAATAAEILARMEGEQVDEIIATMLRRRALDVPARLQQAICARKPSGSRPFIAVLDDEECSYAARETAIHVLRRRGTPRALGALRAHLKYGDHGLRPTLVRALGSFEGGAGLDDMVQAVGDSDALVRLAVAETLDPARSASERDALTEMLADRATSVRRAAVEQLRRTLGERSRESLLGMLGHHKGRVLESVIRLLGEQLDGGVAARLIDLGRQRSGDRILATLAATLLDDEGLLSPDQRVEVEGWLRELSRHADEQVRAAAMRSFRGLDSAAARDELLHRLENDDARQVRYEAAVSLGSHRDERVVEALLARLDGAEPYVQAAILEALGQQRAPGARAAMARFAGEGPEALADVARASLARLEGEEC